MAHKILVKDTVTGQCGLADPQTVPTFCAAANTQAALAGGLQCVIDPAAQNAISVGPAGKLFVSPVVFCTIANIQALATGLGCVISSAAGNVLTVGADGKLTVPSTAVPTFCGLAATQAAAAGGLGCAIDPAAGNAISVGPAGKLFVSPSASAPTFCAAANTQAALAGGLGCVVSSAAGNVLAIGADGKLTVPASAVATFCGLAATQAAAAGGLGCAVSADAGNATTIGADGKIYTNLDVFNSAAQPTGTNVRPIVWSNSGAATVNCVPPGNVAYVNSAGPHLLTSDGIDVAYQSTSAALPNATLLPIPFDGIFATSQFGTWVGSTYTVSCAGVFHAELFNAVTVSSAGPVAPGVPATVAGAIQASGSAFVQWNDTFPLITGNNTQSGNVSWSGYLAAGQTITFYAFKNDTVGATATQVSSYATVKRLSN
jgi:hypothetical protein